MLMRQPDVVVLRKGTSSWCPESVAVIGASDDPNKVGGRPIHYMTRFGFSGRIFPINPRRSSVQGRACFSRLEDIGTVPQAAVIAIAGDAACEAVRQCADLGVSTAVLMASGFGETGPAGKAVQDELIAYANEHGLRVIGPNAQGIANFSNGAVLNFSTMFMDVVPADGPVAIISQSGAASVMPYALLRERGIGVRYLAATGNDADLGVSELVWDVVHDPDIRLILVYAETVSQPRYLAEAARIAHARGAQIILLKGGVSQRGAAAAASHTGAMMGADGPLDAFLRAHGIERAHDIHELVNSAPLYVRRTVARGDRTVVMSHSGAVGVLCADAAERAGLPLTDLSEETLSELANIIPSFASAANPLDLTAGLLGNGEIFPKVLDALGRDAGADMFAIGIPVAGPGYDVPALAKATASLMSRYGKPVVVTAPQASVRTQFEAAGVPTFVSETDAIDALRQFSRPRPAVEALTEPEPEAISANNLHGLQDEALSLALLGEAGLPIVEHVVCEDVKSTAEAAAALGGRVVVKGCAAEVPHKSEHGLVHLGLIGIEAVQEAANDCLATLDRMGVAHGRVMVAKMARGLHEFLLGVSVDPLFGPVVSIGEGGTLVEVRRDVVTLLAPFSVDTALAAMRGLRIAPVLNGVRGQPALDKRALAGAAVALGKFALRHRQSLISVDMNPVMVMAEGQGVVVVDAVVQFKERT